MDKNGVCLGLALVAVVVGVCLTMSMRRSSRENFNGGDPQVKTTENQQFGADRERERVRAGETGKAKGQEALILAFDDHIRQYILAQVLDTSTSSDGSVTNSLLNQPIANWNTQYEIVGKLNTLQEFRRTLKSALDTLDDIKE